MMKNKFLNVVGFIAALLLLGFTVSSEKEEPKYNTEIEIKQDTRSGPTRFRGVEILEQ